MAMYQFYVLNVHMSKTPPEEVLQGLFSIVGRAKKRNDSIVYLVP